MDLAPYLEKLEAALDPAHFLRAQARQMAAVSYQEVDHLPQIIGFPVKDWPTFPYSQGFQEMDKMLANELAGPYSGALAKDDRVYSVRANYGVGIVPSLFGCKTRLMGDQMPYANALTAPELDAALDAGPPEITKGLGGRALETEEFYLSEFSDYPKITGCVRVYVCDTQGPFDLAHLIMGHDIYTEIYDNPNRVHRLLEVACETHIRFTQAQKKLIGEFGNWHYHNAFYSRGAIRICEDSSTNLSTETYLEFCRPYNEQLLESLGGGWVHYCGKGHQILESVISTPGLCGINFGNPELQDVGRVLELAAEYKVAILGFPANLLGEYRPETGLVISG